LNRRITVRGFVDLMPSHFEECAQRIPDVAVIVNDQNAACRHDLPVRPAERCRQIGLLFSLRSCLRAQRVSAARSDAGRDDDVREQGNWGSPLAAPRWAVRDLGLTEPGGFVHPRASLSSRWQHRVPKPAQSRLRPRPMRGEGFVGRRGGSKLVLQRGDEEALIVIPC
jgi:hypothetical protein